MGRKLVLAILILSITAFLYSKVDLVFSQTEYTALDRRDPFESQLPKVVEEVKEAVSETIKRPVVPPQLIVESLIAGGYIPQAIVGGRIYRIGDRIGEPLITDITKEGVEIIYQGQMFLFPAPSKTLQPINKGDDNEK